MTGCAKLKRSAPEPVPRARLRREEGFALLSAILVIVVVTGVLLDHALRARTDRGIAINTRTLVGAWAAARAGEQHALSWLRVLQERELSAIGKGVDFADHWNDLANRKDDLMAVELAPGVSYSVKIWDSASRVSLNEAHGAELRDLFIVLGIDASEASAVAESIVAWRNRTTLAGSIDNENVREPTSSINPILRSRFRDLDELRSVPGIAGIHDMIVPYLTLHARGRVNLNTAKPPVLHSVIGLKGEAAEAILEHRRRNRPFRNFYELESALTVEGRARLHEHSSELLPRLIFEPEIIEILSIGMVELGVVQSSVHAVAVRSSRGVPLVKRSEK